MTQDEKYIKKLLERFAEGWLKSDTAGIEKTMTEDCITDFSILEPGLTRREFAVQLSKRTRNVTYSRFEIYNDVCCTNGYEAQQSAVIAGLFVDESTEKPASFYFNFFLVAHVLKTSDGWKYNALRGELGSGSDQHVRLYSTGVKADYSGGDISFVRHWHNVDTTIGWYPGSRLLRIVPEFDAPWYAIKNRVSEMSDEEKLNELVYKYCFALDHDVLRLYHDVFSEDLRAIYDGNRLYDKRSCTAMLKFERAGMIGRGHIVYIDHCSVDGDVATAHLYRTGYVPAELCTGENKYKNWPCARYHMKFRKEDGKWRILELNYLPGRLERPWHSSVWRNEL